MHQVSSEPWAVTSDNISAFVVFLIWAYMHVSFVSQMRRTIQKYRDEASERTNRRTSRLVRQATAQLSAVRAMGATLHHAPAAAPPRSPQRHRVIGAML